MLVQLSLQVVVLGPKDGVVGQDAAMQLAVIGISDGQGCVYVGYGGLAGINGLAAESALALVFGFAGGEARFAATGAAGWAVGAVRTTTELVCGALHGLVL